MWRVVMALAVQHAEIQSSLAKALAEVDPHVIKREGRGRGLKM